MIRVLPGDCRDVLPTLDAGSVQCCVTSPPYWGLRDYGVTGQIGRELTPDAFVAEMVSVFREVRRVLRDDGTLWLNLGDTYSPVNRGENAQPREASGFRPLQAGNPHSDLPTNRDTIRAVAAAGIKQKDLLGIPWMVAFALRADGWWLRSDIIWAKPNPMPESVTDRPTSAHEHIFLLTKSARYFYDAEAVREQSLTDDPRRPYTSEGAWELDGRPVEQRHGGKPRTAGNKSHKYVAEYEGSDTEEHRTKAGLMKVADVPWHYRNIRNVWTIATAPYADAHFATFPPELAERCIKAGTSERGCCPKCGAPWIRNTQREDTGWDGSRYGERAVAATGGAKTGGTARSTLGSSNGKLTGHNLTLSWSPSCECSLVSLMQSSCEPVPCTVLDPFAGAGTTGLVADRLGRHATLIELNPAYCDMLRARITGDAPLLADVQ